MKIQQKFNIHLVIVRLANDRTLDDSEGLELIGEEVPNWLLPANQAHIFPVFPREELCTN